MVCAPMRAKAALGLIPKLSLKYLTVFFPFPFASGRISTFEARYSCLLVAEELGKQSTLPKKGKFLRFLENQS